MSKPDLSPPPSWRTVAPTQLRMLAQLQKRDFMVLGIIVAGLVALSIWGIFHTSPPRNPSHGAVMFFALLAIPFAIMAALWPLGVWRKDAPERRGYFWSLPAPRAPHTLVRVAAGWVLLMIACVAVMLVTWALLLVAVARLGPATLSFGRWYVPLLTATLAYVIVSSLAVFTDGPVRVVMWTVVAVLGGRVVADVAKLKWLGALIDTIVSSFGMALAGPLGPHHSGPEIVVNGGPYTVGFTAWGTNYLIWLGLGAAALLFAAFRYQDAR